jgi:hypothetical protein
MTNQKQIILNMLQSGGWISTVDFVRQYILRGSERIRELKASGHEIESRRKEGTPYQEYRLVPKQETLI